MRLLRGKLASAALAVFYGSVVALGQALHLLPGLDHFSGTAGHCDATEHCCSRHEHCHDAAGPEHSDENAAGNACDCCPICEFLALGQDRPADVTPLASDERVEPAACSDHSVPYCEPIRLPSPRGPPSA